MTTGSTSQSIQSASKPIQIVGTRVQSWILPLSPPIRGATERPGFLLTLVDSAGRVGRGDAAPWPGFGSDLATAEADLRLAAEQLLGAPVGDIERASACCVHSPEARYAVETALLDLLGELGADDVPISYLVGTPEQALDALEAGASALKLKVGGGSLASDVARVAAVRQAVGPAVPIRLDANGAWSVRRALEAVAALADLGIELLEQPVARIEDLATVRRATSIPIGADELLTDEAALEAVIAAEAADVAVLKPMFVGGIIAARRMADRALAAGLQVVVTHALESAVGRRGAVHLAAGLPPGMAHGLGPLPEQPRRRANTNPPCCGSEIPNPVTSSAIARPDHPAVITDSATCSWRELDQASAREATVLGGLGLGAGDTIALWSERSAPFVATLHAIGRVGAAAAPLDKRRTGLIASMEAARATTLLCTDAGQSVPSGIDSIRMIDHPDLPAAADRFQPLNEVRLVVLTSGTTGTPRAIRLTTLQIMTSAFGSAIRLGHDPADRWLCCLPLHHVGGLSILLRSAFYGITTILGEAGDERATLMSLVPTQLQRLLDARGVVPFGPHLRAILLGGGPTSPALLARCEALSIPVSVTWGMTEAASQIATRAPGDTRPDAGAGTPLPFVRVQSVDGVLVARGPIVRGVLATRDRGRVDAEGRVHVGGRSDDAIISGGENIDPAAVEAVLDAHPDIAESAVVAIAHPEWGQRPAAVIVAAGDRQPTDEQLAAYCRERLSRYEVPDEFRWIDGLPRNALGKVVKHGLETC